MSFEAFTALVRDIKQDLRQNLSAGLDEVLRNIEDKQNVSRSTGSQHIFGSRGKTGRLAEEFFIRCFQQDFLPYEGKLIDRRDDGCGYDFLIAGSKSVLVEVKGLAGTVGGILLTDKEWQTAEKGDNYMVFLAYNLGIEKPLWKLLLTQPGSYNRRAA